MCIYTYIYMRMYVYIDTYICIDMHMCIRTGIYLWLSGVYTYVTVTCHGDIAQV